MIKDETQIQTQTLPIKVDSKSSIKAPYSILESPEKLLFKLKSYLSHLNLQWTLFELLFKEDLITSTLLEFMKRKDTLLNLRLTNRNINHSIKNSSFWIRKHESILTMPPLIKHESWMNTLQLNIKSNRNWMNSTFNLTIQSIIPLRDAITG